MSGLVAVALYAIIGAAASLLRAYIDPLMIEMGAMSESRGARSRSLFYSEAVALHFVLWPLALPTTGLTFLAERYRLAGIEAHKQRQQQREAAKAAEREIDRIIKEHAL